MGEADIPELACLLRVDERAIGAVIVEDAMRIVIPDDLVMLHEVEAIGLQPLERGVELTHGFGVRSPVNLRHQKDLPPVAIAERLPHANLARAVVVVPAVVHEVDATVDRRANDPETQRLVDVFQGQVPATKADRGHVCSCPAQRAVRIVASTKTSKGILAAD